MSSLNANNCTKEQVAGILRVSSGGK